MKHSEYQKEFQGITLGMTRLTPVQAVTINSTQSCSKVIESALLTTIYLPERDDTDFVTKTEKAGTFLHF